MIIECENGYSINRNNVSCYRIFTASSIENFSTTDCVLRAYLSKTNESILMARSDNPEGLKEIIEAIATEEQLKKHNFMPIK